MADRYASPGTVDLALALLVMAMGLALLAASAMFLLPALVIAGPLALLVGRVARLSTDAGKALGRGVSPRRGSAAALPRTLFSVNRNDWWHRPPTEAA